MKDPVPDTLTLDEATKESQYVHQVYDQIASHFSDTRFKPWPVITSYLDRQPRGSLGVDVGCGNGKYLRSADIFMLGTDLSPPLVDICGQRGHDALVSDALQLPFRSGAFDFAISIAVIHHMASDERRKRAIEELVRVVRDQGTVLVFVWALEQETKGRRRFDGSTQDVLVPWVVPGSRQDEHAPDQVFHRYYHLFRDGELAQLAGQVPGCTVVESGYDRDNWYVVIQRQNA
ncbi:tRNA methyltransferase, has a role in tRNA modification [Coemansia sp. RSA 2711]|nr:tRNA methyltransferase, has a role in tRNA modification [Coemansia sp. RSA 2711]KAJ1830318.1 tRNA methyltransferase, has a role in tRNA modification [Coemansia sp. RSA 2711]